ncbi:MAG: dTDP-4-dehydrorhamnose 3,5-epimerase [Candidatus Marinimicrobia bacterium]|jgi:dTDP-4-dehydrorhamnose 3,5-epimerase|nr:dTDP-4-dehydrorhamnose 3,5-epimerase [Candidatus Neomarinimicrobiota bacterium]|tara:strand:- start:5587 stop:6117 length:531 start_codon:yes stop_codon:yes gene_type:complete
MIFNKTKIDGVMLIESEPFIDERGAFRRHFCKDEFAKNNIVTDVSQCNVSENKFARTLRGFHYQLQPFSEGKTLSCLNGKIFDIVVDLRKESATYMEWVGLELSKENRKSVHIAPGCANAFLTLEDNSLIHYYCSQSYNPESERGVRFNDPAFGFEWPETPKIISEKDLSHPDYIK